MQPFSPRPIVTEEKLRLRKVRGLAHSRPRRDSVPPARPLPCSLPFPSHF